MTALAATPSAHGKDSRVYAYNEHPLVTEGIDLPRHYYRWNYHPIVYRGKRLPRIESRINLRNLDPCSRHLDGNSTVFCRSHHPRKQHRPNDCICCRNSLRSDLHPPRLGYCRLVERFSLLDDNGRLRSRWPSGRYVLDPAASRAGDRI